MSVALLPKYTRTDIVIKGPEVKDIYERLRLDKAPGKRFKDECLKLYPSVFHEWFLEAFPEPTSWLRGRLAYSRTAAVMSIAGFVLG